MRQLLLLIAFVVNSFGQELLLQNAQIVDPAAQKISRGHILIRDGKIAQILTAVPKGFKGEPIDLAGKWVIPGLNDMHVHSFGNMAPGNNLQLLMTTGTAKMMLYCGVTGFLDLFSSESQIFADREQQRKNGADIYCAGPILTCTKGHGTEYGIPTRVINSPAEAEKEISELALKKPDVVKIVYDHAAVKIMTGTDCGNLGTFQGFSLHREMQIMVITQHSFPIRQIFKSLKYPSRNLSNSGRRLSCGRAKTCAAWRCG